MSDIDDVPEWVECDCDPADPCGYCEPCPCEAHALLMPDLCDNDPRNWDTEDQP